MRFTLSSSALSSRLSTLSKVINSKNSLAILDCFLFDVKNNTLTITASDSENVLTTTLALTESDGEGRFAVNNKTILDAVRELPEQPLTIDVNTQEYTIKVVYQNGIYNFTAQNADEYPNVPVMGDNATSLQIPSGVLSDNISRSLFATATEELRKSESPMSFILPKKPATLLKGILVKDESEVLVRFDERNAEVRFGDSVLMCRLIEGRYPNYNSVIPQDNPNQLTIDRKVLIGALRRVLPFASESSQLVRLHLEPGLLEVSSEDIDFSTSAKEQIACDYAGSTMNIGFKGPSLSEILNNLTSDEVELLLADPSRPCLVMPAQQPENEDVLMLIMPMLLND